MRRCVAWVCAIAVGATLASGVMGQTAATQATAAPSQQDLLDRIKALQEQVDQLKAQVSQIQPTTRPATQPTSAAPLPAASPAEVRATSEQVAADANRHGNLMQVEGITAGYVPNQGFIIRSEDGRFLLHPWAFMQVRYAVNYRDNAKNGDESSTDQGFELPRMKFVLDGNIFSPDLTYQIIWATSDVTGNLGLQDAWGRYHFPNTPLAVEAGQIRNPLDHEQILYATRSLTPERSIVNNVLLNGDDVVKGASISYGFDTPSIVRGQAAFTSGQRNFDTTFQGFPTNPSSWGLAARGEWKAMGNWNDYSQFTALGDKANLLVFGVGADYTEAGDTSGLTYVVDAQFNTPDRLTLYGAYLGRYVRNNGSNSPASDGGFTGAGPSHNTYDSTVRLMAGYLVDRHLEPFVRYEYLQFSPNELPPNARHGFINNFTAGMNYYFYGHRAKFSGALSYLPDGSPISNTNSDLLANHGGTELILQTQFQLIF